jgi:NADH-quinone oxidoreductase subunit J
MIESLLQDLDTLLLVLFALCALVGAALTVVLRQPMRVALALISTMVFLGGIYGLLGVHFIAAFQVLIYVGAVMVFMVYVIMLLDVRDPSFVQRYGRSVWPGIVLGALLFVVLLAAGTQLQSPDPLTSLEASATSVPSYLVRPFSAEFLREYWLHFELTSVLLVAAVVAAIAVIRGGSRRDG